MNRHELPDASLHFTRHAEQRLMQRGLSEAAVDACLVQIGVVPGTANLGFLYVTDVLTEDLALILFDQAQLAEGGQLEDPAAFVGRLNKLMLGMMLSGG